MVAVHICQLSMKNDEERKYICKLLHNCVNQVFTKMNCISLGNDLSSFNSIGLGRNALI